MPFILYALSATTLTPFSLVHRAILAIRNCCEGNAANQDFVRGLTQRGVVPDAELGVNVHIDGNTGRLRVGPSKEPPV